MDYSAYQELKFRRLEPGVLEIVMGEEGGKLPVTTARMHAELARIWLDVDLDRDTRVAILRGAGKGFSAGGDLAMVEEMTRDFAVRARVWREARDLVYHLINCSKMVVSAMHGPAVGAGLVAGLLADISIAAKNARLIGGHTRLGVAAGDHAAIVWPLLCGMAKAKYYLLLCEQISGEEAERLGLVSLACEEAELQAKALEVARKLAAGAQTALRWTKYSLNNWLRMAGPTFDASLALEVLGFTGPEAKEGVASHREKRKPSFPDPNQHPGDVFLEAARQSRREERPPRAVQAHAQLRLLAGRSRRRGALRRADSFQRRCNRGGAAGGAGHSAYHHHPGRNQLSLRGVPHAVDALRRRRRILPRRPGGGDPRALGLAPRAPRLRGQPQARRGAALAPQLFGCEITSRRCPIV